MEIQIQEYQQLNFSFFTFKKIKTFLNKKGEEKKDASGLPTDEERKNITINQPLIKKGDKCIGILTGAKSDIIIIDCDDAESYDKLLNEYPDFKKYYTVKSNKGHHIYCKYEPDIPTSIKKINGIDILSDGSIVYAPPTKYKLLNGLIAEYKFLGGDILPIPNYLVSQLKEKKNKDKTNLIIKSPTTKPIPIHESEINSNFEALKEFYFCFSHKRLENRDTWIKVGALIYSLGHPLSFFIELSKTCSEKFQDGACEKAWNTYKYKGYDIGTLMYWSRQDNTKKFQELKLKYNFSLVQDKCLVEQKDITQRYLLDKIDDDNFTICSTMRNHLDTLFNTDIKVLNIRSPYKTSKTQLMIKVIEEYKPKRILMLSYRKTLTYDFDFNFKPLGFENYLEGDISADRIIVQLESLLRLDTIDLFATEVQSYDLVILDESESILKQFSSHKTFHGTERDVFEYLQKVIDNSSKVIALDGDQGNATYSFTNTIGKSINLNNKVITHNYEISLCDHLQTWKDEIIKDLKNNDKVVIASMSASEITQFYNDLKEMFPEKVIYLYTGQTDMKMKAEHAKNIKQAWFGVDCVVYSSCFESGVNYDVEGHFKKIYGYLITGGTSQRGFYQMISRVRQVKSDKILTYKGDLPDNDVNDFYTFEEVKKEMIGAREKILKYIYTMEDGKWHRKLDLDTYSINAIYSKVEELNKNSFYFLSYFKQLGLSKGYKITYHNDLFQEHEDTEDKIKLDKISPILNAKDCTQEEYNELLRRQKANIATEEDIIRTTKASYKNNLGVDILTENIMKCYYRKEHTIRNFMDLINPETEIIADNQHNEEKKIKLQIVRDIITLLGWVNGTDEREKNKKAFDEGLLNLIGKSPIFTDQKMVKIYFEMSKSKIDTSNSKQALRYINEFLKHYSIKIDISYNGKKEEKNKIFKLIEIHNVSEIVEYLVKSGRYEACKEYKKPKQYLFSECILPEIISNVQYCNDIELNFEL